MSTRKDFENENDGSVITKDKVKKPSLYKVILMNDDFTPMEFVVHILLKFFGKAETEATKIMLQVHKSGSSIVGVYTYEIAQTKTHQVNDYSKQFEFPLLCKFEKE